MPESEPTAQYASVLELPLLHAGKVRELYAVNRETQDPDSQAPESQDLLMVATDNISAFDHVLPTRIPDKGAILTRMSLWWFDALADLVDNHVISTEVPAPVRGRALRCEKLEMIPVECVARGYLTGSSWLEYQRTGTICGIRLPDGLQDGSRLPEPIFTPATKAGFGEHDENVDYATVGRAVGAEVAATIRALTLALYARAAGVAKQGGIILADTKFEFGRRSSGQVILADEVLTPDSSRFWDADSWQPGGRLESYDKQYVRNWLLYDSGWDKNSGSTPPPLPAEVVAATRAKYVEAYQRLTGATFEVEVAGSSRLAGDS